MRRAAALLHVLLQRALLAIINDPGELQLRTVRRAQAQGQTQPTTLLHGGVRATEIWTWKFKNATLTLTLWGDGEMRKAFTTWIDEQNENVTLKTEKQCPFWEKILLYCISWMDKPQSKGRIVATMFESKQATPAMKDS